MARRDRVPRHKSHNHKRNKNAKLSPFQREQKREKLANQVPTVSSMGSVDSIPHSQRHVFDYLQEKARQQKEKRAALLLERQGKDKTEDSNEESAAQATSTVSHSGDVTASDATAPDGAASPSSSASKRFKKQKPVYASLNAELTASVGAALQPSTSRHGASASVSSEETPDAPRTVEEVIARKKERKHKRKQEARHARVAEKLADMEEELTRYVHKTNGGDKKKKKLRRARGGGEDEDGGEEKGERDGSTFRRGDKARSGVTLSARDKVERAFERELRTMSKTAEAQASAAAASKEKERVSASSNRKRSRSNSGIDDAEMNVSEAAAATGSLEDASSLARKRISFDPAVTDHAAVQKAKKKNTPQDFYELVDVVRYGERVEAPPVFDVVPNHNAAVSRLATKLAMEEAQTRHKSRNGRAIDAGAEERHRLLASGSGLGQQKRLARLGLAPAITHTVRAEHGAPQSSSSGASRVSKRDEIKALRDRVMATYLRNRRKEVTEKKGVDMQHEFPKFS